MCYAPVGHSPPYRGPTGQSWGSMNNTFTLEQVLLLDSLTPALPSYLSTIAPFPTFYPISMLHHRMGPNPMSLHPPPNMVIAPHGSECLCSHSLPSGCFSKVVTTPLPGLLPIKGAPPKVVNMPIHSWLLLWVWDGFFSGTSCRGLVRNTLDVIEGG